MDQAAAAAAQAQLAAVQGLPEARDQPQVGLVVRLGRLGRNNNNNGEDSDDERDDKNDSDDDDDVEEDSDDEDVSMPTDDESGYESDDSVVFLGEVIHLD